MGRRNIGGLPAIVMRVVFAWGAPATVLAALLVGVAATWLTSASLLAATAAVLIVTVVGVATWRWPVAVLVAGLVIGPGAQYLRYDNPLGKLLPFALFSAVVLGGIASVRRHWVKGLVTRLYPVALPTLSFGLLLPVGVGMVLAQRSPLIARLLGGGILGWIPFVGTEGLAPQTTLPILRAGGLLLGPLAGLLVTLLLVRASEDQRARMRGLLVGGILLGGGLTALAGLGQAWVPGFPIRALRPPVSGLSHNPVELAMILTLITPLAMAVALRSKRFGWLRWVAIADVILAACLFFPMRQRSAQLGLLLGSVIFFLLWGVPRMRARGFGLRRIALVVSLALALVVLGLVIATPSTEQWQALWSGILADPLSTAWLGVGMRLELNRMAFLMVFDRPLAGFGPAGFEAALAEYYARHGVITQRYDHSLLNHPLHMWVDLGFLGLAFNAWLFASFVLPTLWRLVTGPEDTDRRRRDKELAAGALGAGLAFSVLSIWTGENVYAAIPSVFLFVILAIPLASTEFSRSTSPRHVPAPWLPMLLVAWSIAFVKGL